MGDIFWNGKENGEENLLAMYNSSHLLSSRKLIVF